MIVYKKASESFLSKAFSFVIALTNLLKKGILFMLSIVCLEAFYEEIIGD